MSPHGNLARVVDELELTRETLELLICLAVLNSDFEKSIVVALSQGLLHWNSGELLVGRIVR